MKILKRAVDISHELISKVLSEGDTAIDGTAGNGNDTAFMARLVGDSGCVYSFDIQSAAIDRTRQRVKDENLSNRVELINDSHDKLELYVKKAVKAAMFNLGYLPKGDHKIVTNPATTIGAISKASEILEVGGILTIAIYYGHEGGQDEKNSVIEFCSGLNQDKFAVQKFEFINFRNDPPILIAIERLN